MCINMAKQKNASISPQQTTRSPPSLFQKAASQCKKLKICRVFLLQPSKTRVFTQLYTFLHKDRNLLNSKHTVIFTCSTVAKHRKECETQGHAHCCVTNKPKIRFNIGITVCTQLSNFLANYSRYR